MRKNSTPLLLLTILAFALSTPAVAQLVPSVVHHFDVRPIDPQAGDSIRIRLTYVSNDGCPDYRLGLLSQDSTGVHLTASPIPDEGRICAQVISKFQTEINLGPLPENTAVWVDDSLLYTHRPACKLTKKGVVMKAGDACDGMLLVCEHTPYPTLLPVLYALPGSLVRNASGVADLALRVGDEVAFGSRPLPDSTVRPGPTCILAGQVTCCELLYRKPDCTMSRTGVVVKGIDGCTGQWLVKELSPAYSYPRWYVFDNKEQWAPGTTVLFGATDYPSDSTRSILCPVRGSIDCILAATIQIPDTLAGTAYTGDSVLKAGTAVLFRKGIRKALKSCTLTDGKFQFNVFDQGDYTVYVVPDRSVKSGYLPTFYVNKLAWANADYYSLQDGMNEIAVNLRKYQRRNGTGKIHGNVYFETANLKDSILNYYGDRSTFYTTDHTRAVNLPVILFDAGGSPVAWTLSDSIGNYVFEDIALDTYTIFTETSEAQAETTVSLTNAQPSVGADIVMKASDSTNDLKQAAQPTLQVYPNPVGDRLTLTLSREASVLLMDAAGKTLMKKTLHAGTNHLATTTLASGFYVLRIGSETHKIVKQ